MGIGCCLEVWRGRPTIDLGSVFFVSCNRHAFLCRSTTNVWSLFFCWSQQLCRCWSTMDRNSNCSCSHLHPSLPGLQRVGLWVNPKHGHTFKISKTAGSKISYPLDPEFLGLSLEPIRFSDFCPPPFFPKQKWTNHFIASVARPTTVTCETTVEQTGMLYKEKNLSAHLDWSNDFICVRNAKNACSVVTLALS